MNYTNNKKEKIAGFTLKQVEEIDDKIKIKDSLRVIFTKEVIIISKSYLKEASVFGSEDFNYLNKVFATFSNFKRIIINDA